MKFYKVIFFILLGVLLTLGMLYLRDQLSFGKKYTEENQTMVLEKIRKVAELTTIKGQISEIYDYKDYYMYDVWPLRKQALIRVKADVSIGYDLESLELITDNENKIIRIGNLPSPQILSIEHELDYYDMSEGIFNVFDNKDITDLSQKAKEFIRQKAMTSSLYKAAEEQKHDFVETLKAFLINTGWALEIGENFLD